MQRTRMSLLTTMVTAMAIAPSATVYHPSSGGRGTPLPAPHSPSRYRKQTRNWWSDNPSPASVAKRERNAAKLMSDAAAREHGQRNARLALTPMRGEQL